MAFHSELKSTVNGQVVHLDPAMIVTQDGHLDRLRL